MKISILCSDLSNNRLGRAYILAKALQRYYEVEIVGPVLGKEIWEPIRNDASIHYKFLDPRHPIQEVKKIDGDIIYASKPKGASLGYGLLARRQRRRPLILDIDDWEVGFYSLQGKLYHTARFWDINNFPNTYLMEKVSKRADYITVSNTFLKNKFGGTLIPHFRDTDHFNPAKFEGEQLKKKYLGKNNKVILFLGTLRKHKGVPELIQAVEKLKREDVTLLIVGATEKEIRQLPSKPYLKILGRQPFDEIPKFLAMADIVTIFQADTKASQGQLPAKVFDAMAMAKPIIASRVSDLPSVLKGCGELVAPGDINELTQKITYLLDNPKYAKELGRKARERCIREYSYDAIAPKLHRVVEDVLAKARTTAKT